MDEPAVAAVICAAGSSTRMKSGKKEYLSMPAVTQDGRRLTVLGAAVSAFAAVSKISSIVIAVPDDPLTGESAARQALPPELLAKNAQPQIFFTAGGSTRRASVHKALALLAPRSPAYVLIHDGARPWLSPGLIERLIAAVREHKAVIPLLPLTETPKETGAPLTAFSQDGAAPPVFIQRHLRRMFTGTAQTPQAFAFPEILAAHEKAAVQESAGGVEYTDDAGVWAAFYGQVAAIPGLPENRKITFPEDLETPISFLK